jgi:hypothetical protein
MTWNTLIVLGSLSTSFEYAFYGAFSNFVANKESFENFFLKDKIYNALFLVDFVILIYSNRHKALKSEDSLNKTRTINSQVIIDFIAILPLSLIFDSLISRRVYWNLYLLKILRLVRGYKLLDYKKLTGFLRV